MIGESSPFGARNWEDNYPDEDKIEIYDEEAGHTPEESVSTEEIEETNQERE